MSANSVKRILSDINNLTEHPLDSEGIYWHVNQENIYDFRALIIGPKGTPYQGGFYFFEFTIPQSYPLEPPKAKYCTQFNDIRFNPNLYTNGTVCLSILNTWAGPSWTPCNTLSSILMSLLGLVFVEHPLVNEPGFENSDDYTLGSYDSIIEHESFRGAVLYMLEHIVPGFEMFQSKIEQYFIKHYDEYREHVLYLKKYKDKRSYSLGVYSISLSTNYGNIMGELTAKYQKLTGIEFPEFSETTVQKLRKIAEGLNVDTKKTDSKGKKKVYKLKKELYDDIKMVKSS